jgi:hypothetical protein
MGVLRVRSQLTALSALVLLAALGAESVNRGLLEVTNGQEAVTRLHLVS